MIYLAALGRRRVLDDVVDDVGRRQACWRRGAEKREAEGAEAGVAAAQGDQQLLLSHHGTLILTSSLSFAMHRVSHHFAPSRTALALDRAIRDAPPLFGLSSSSALLSLRDGVSIPRARTPTRGTGRRPPPSSRRTAKRSSAALGLPRSHSPPWRGKRTRHDCTDSRYTHTPVLREEIRREGSPTVARDTGYTFHGVANVTTQASRRANRLESFAQPADVPRLTERTCGATCVHHRSFTSSSSRTPPIRGIRQSSGAMTRNVYKAHPRRGVAQFRGARTSRRCIRSESNRDIRKRNR